MQSTSTWGASSEVHCDELGKELGLFPQHNDSRSLSCQSQGMDWSESLTSSSMCRRPSTWTQHGEGGQAPHVDALGACEPASVHSHVLSACGGHVSDTTCFVFLSDSETRLGDSFGYQLVSVSSFILEK